MISRYVAVGLACLVAWPPVAAAQAQKAGIVTTLEGAVSARRVSVADPVPLKFKDDVFHRDTVVTGDRALARLLLGGKAVVTVRERSTVTLTDTPGRSTIDLQNGKIALAVAREKMRPGEEIEIRTPNAVAGVRGTVVVAEVERRSAQVGAAAPAVVTNFYVIRGSIVAQPVDATGLVGAPVQVSTLQAFARAGNAPGRVAPIPPGQLGQITAGLQPSGPKPGGGVGQDQIKAQALLTTATLLTALTTSVVDTTAAPSAATPALSPVTTPVAAPVTPIGVLVQQDFSVITDIIAAQTAEQFVGATISLTDQPFRSFNAPFTSTTLLPRLSFSGSQVTQSGADVAFIDVSSDVGFAGSLMSITDSSITTAGTLLGIQNAHLTSTGTDALISVDPTVVATGKSLVTLDGGALTLSGPLLSAVNSTLTSDLFHILDVQAASLTSTTTQPLISVSGSSVTAGGATAVDGTPTAGRLVNVEGGGASITSNGPLFSATSSTLTTTADLIGVFNGGHINVAGSLLSLANSLASTPARSNILVNGGFESGSFAPEWNVFIQSGSAGNFFVQSGTQSPQFGFAVPPPRSGTFAAMTDQGGPGVNVLYRDITVPREAPVLRFALFLGNRAGVFATPNSLTLPNFNVFGPPANQQARVDLISPGADIQTVDVGLLRNLFQTQPGMAPVAASYQLFSADLSDFAGQTVRLRFAEADNSGNFQLGVDDVEVFTEANALRVDGGAVVMTGGDPLLNVQGGTLTIGGDLVVLKGGASVTLSGPLVGADDSTLTVDGALLRMDHALLEASAPLLDLRNNSVLTTTVDGINMVQNAQLTTVGPLFRIDASMMTILNGHAVNMAGGSVLNVGSDLFQISNGGRLTIANGAALFASGGSAVNINGGLVNFTAGGGNQLNITNALCAPCVNLGGINVQLQNGALAGNVSITNAIRNGGNGAINLSSGNAAVLVVDGAATRVTILGR